MAKAVPSVSKTQMDNVFALYEDESPRSKILIIGSALDEGLKKLLQSHLVAAGDKDELLDQYRPIGEFKVRIDLAQRLGLISPQLAGDLHIVRKLRNNCAHDLEDFDFESGPTRDRVDLLYKHLGKGIKRHIYSKGDPETSEEKFEFVTTLYMFYIEDMTEAIQPIRPGHLELNLYEDRDLEEASKPPRRRQNRRR